MRKKWYLFLSALVGLFPLILQSLRFELVVALIAPITLALASYLLLRNLALPDQIRWTVLGAAVATGSFYVPLFLFGGISSILSIAAYWSLWFLAFSIPVILFLHWLGKVRVIYKPACFLGMFAAIYLMTGLISFKWWTHYGSHKLEPHERRNYATIGPDVTPVCRLVCVARGMSTGWMTSYSGLEWCWKIYRPLIDCWFFLHPSYTRIDEDLLGKADPGIYNYFTWCESGDELSIDHENSCDPPPGPLLHQPRPS